MIPKDVLYDAVLSAVIAHHHHTSARSKKGDQIHQRAFKSAQFVVDSDAQCLKESRKRLGLMMRRYLLNHQISQVKSGAQRSDCPTLHNGLCESSRLRFIPIGEEQPGQRLFRTRVQNIGGRLALSHEAHIKGRLQAEAEAPFVMVELIRGNAQVQQHPVHGSTWKVLGHR